MTHFEQFGRAFSCVAFIAAAGLLVSRRRELDPRVFHLLLASLVAIAASEFASAIAVDFNGSLKVAAHLLEVVSLYLIYAAFVEFGLKRPYDLVFRSLKASAERLRLHVQQSSLAAIEWDTDFRVVAWNPAAEKIFGYTAEEAAGQHWTFLVPSHARPKVDDVWARLSKGQVDAQSINENLTKDGRTILCDWHNTPLTNAEGEFVCVVSLAEDVTERKQAERGADAGNAADGSIVGAQSHDGPAHGGGHRRGHRGRGPLDGKQIGYLALMNDDESVLTMRYWSKSAMAQCGVIDKPMIYPVEETGSVGRGRSAASPGHHQRLCRAQSAQARHAPGTRARRPAHEHPRVRRPTNRGRGGRRQQRRRLRPARPAPTPTPHGRLVADRDAQAIGRRTARERGEVQDAVRFLERRPAVTKSRSDARQRKPHGGRDVRLRRRGGFGPPRRDGSLSRIPAGRRSLIGRRPRWWWSEPCGTDRAPSRGSIVGRMGASSWPTSCGPRLNCKASRSCWRRSATSPSRGGWKRRCEPASVGCASSPKMPAT